MNSETLLHRQVNPSWVQGDFVTSQAFRPTPKDEKRLSVYDGDQVGPMDSWRHFTGDLGFGSVGVVSVTVAECEEQELPAEPNPEPFPEHVVINFDSCTSSEIKKKSKHLKKAAEIRGWMYRVGAD